MVSDAFFPFRDGVDVGLREGVSAVIQPGGSNNDYQSIEACNERRDHGVHRPAQLLWLLLTIIVLSILVLSKGADWMIDGVVNLARRTGLPKIVIGATIVSLGTTTPEAIVSVTAAFMGNAGLALGNGVGSIIADTGLILGLTCILAVVPVNHFILSRMGWVQVGTATLLVVISLGIAAVTDGIPMLPRWVGIFFLVLLAGYLYASYRWARQGSIELLAAESALRHPQRRSSAPKRARSGRPGNSLTLKQPRRDPCAAPFKGH
jgi:hypothetical protein